MRDILDAVYVKLVIEGLCMVQSKACLCKAVKTGWEADCKNLYELCNSWYEAV